MRPYTEVVAAVCLGRGRVGLARSDPYLSCATQIAELPTTSLRASAHALRRALTDVPIGLVLVGLPMRRRAGYAYAATDADHRRHRRSLARLLLRAVPSLARRAKLCGWDTRMALSEARHEQLTNEQWEGIGGLDAGAPWSARVPRGRPVSAACPWRVCAGAHAAVSLQSLLDEEMGGWPNTFG